MEDRAARYPRLGVGHEERGEEASPIPNRLLGRLLLLDEGSLLLLLKPQLLPSWIWEMALPDDTTPNADA